MNNNLSISFNQKLVSNGKLTVDIEMTDYKSMDVNFFLSNYKISKIFYGKFFMKRLIKKIFKYQLNQNIKWNQNFWNVVKIDVKNAEFKMVNLNSDIPVGFNQYSKSKKKLVYEHIIYSNTSGSRFKDIKNYQELIENGTDLGPPLYISGKCINFLGGNINDHDVFILDGSRRLVANMLSEISPTVLLIDIKK